MLKSAEELRRIRSLIALANQVSADLIEDSRELQQTLSEFEDIANRAIDELVHIIRHYVQDADIRRADVEYKKMQNEELRLAIAAAETQLT